MDLADEYQPWHTARRREVGEHLRECPKSVYEVASVLGGDRSNTRRLLQQLRDAGGVVERPDGPDGRTQYGLAEGQEERLLVAIDAAQPRGQFANGQQLLIVAVDASRQAEFAAALRSADATAGLVWAARVEGADAQYALMFDKDLGSLASLRTAELLRARGLTVTRMIVEEVMPAEGLRRHAAAVRRVSKEAMQRR
jgi:DNA-binding transcriptional ArsR family regulator